MEAVDAFPVLLNIYDLNPSTGEENAAQTVSFFSRILKSTGFGTYHTSLEVNGYCYTFSAMAGIQKSSSANKASHVPTNGEFKESIQLGVLSDYMTQQKINECINRLRQSHFTNTSYHLAGRNCNHFTETFATALFLADGQIDDGRDQVDSKLKLNTYPSWVNRLAKTGAGLMKNDEICDVITEARFAAGNDHKISWNLKSKGTKVAPGKDRKVKKELTDAQKKALAKLRSK